jgi:DNA repair protein RecO (recombination protein O)
MPAEEASAAIVLRARDYSESDRIVTVLTRDFGKLSGIAKGAKASRRRFERKLEPFSHVMLYFRRRLHGQLVFITRAEPPPDLAPCNLDDELGKIALGSYMLELADALTSEGAEASEAYKLLAAALAIVGRGNAGTALRQGFELKFLKWAGFGPEFGRCRVCESPLEDGTGSLFFVPTRGGVACGRCCRPLSEAGIKLSVESASALARLSAAPSLEEAAGSQPAGADGARAISRFISSLLDRNLRSLRFLDSILPTTPGP